MDGVHIVVLCTFAFAQPLFDLLSQSAAFFAIRGSEPVDIVLLAVGLVVVPPLPLLAVEGVAALIDARLRRGVHLVFVALLIAAFVLQVIKRVGGPSEVLIPAALLVGAGAAFLYARAHAVRSFLSILAPVPLVFLVLFLFFSPITRLLGRDEGAALARVEGDTPVVMVVFDEFPLSALLGPDGRIDRVRYPNFARLARGSYWLRNAGTVHELTEHAVPALLTGRRPSRANLPIVADHPRNLFTLLGRTYAIDAEEPITHLCPQQLCPVDPDPLKERMRSLLSDMKIVAPHELLPSDLREHLPPVTQSWMGFAPSGQAGAGDLVAARNFGRQATEAVGARAAAFERFLRGIRPESRPTLDFLHVLLPHVPLEYLPSGRSYAGVDIGRWLFLERWSDDRPAIERAFQRYLLQVRYVDRLLGRLLSRLRATGLYDRALLVVTADHGVSFRPAQSRREVTRTTVADIGPVPLFIKAPLQRSGETVLAPVSSLDVLPTMTDLMDVRLPWKVDGHSAFGRDADRSKQVVYTRHGEKKVFGWSWLEGAVHRAVRRQEALFGWGAERPGLFGIGPQAELVGRRVAALGPVATSARERVHLREADALQSIDRRAAVVPAQLSGWIEGADTGTAQSLAIALNGRIHAVTSTYDDGGRAAFDAMVPESALRHRTNRVEIFDVKESGGRLWLTSLAGA